MSFLDRLLGKSKPEPKLASFQPPHDMKVSEEKMIQVFDGYGREMHVRKSDWVKSVLQGTIQKEWNNPDNLAAVIIQSLNDELFQEMLAPAQRLSKIDPNKERSSVILAIVHLRLGNDRASENVLLDYIRHHGESGIILTNLAKVYAERKQDDRMLETLWHALELDPNQDNAVGWYEVIHREKSGEVAGLDALRQIAALPKRWRARLWLARDALKNREHDGAMKLYDEALASAEKPPPADLLTQMSGDLGNAGCLVEILTLVAPHFDPPTHGIMVGNNLIKACVDLGQLDQARSLVDRLAAEKRFDWQQTLAYWDTEIARHRTEARSTTLEKDIKLSAVNLVGPIWLREKSPAAPLFGEKPSDSVVVCFLGSSATLSSSSTKVTLQMSDTPGRMSRSLPLFLAEQLHMRSDATAQTLQPWINSGAGGFAFFGGPIEPDSAAQYARTCTPKGDYIVTTHLDTTRTPWLAHLRLIRPLDDKVLAETTANIDFESPELGYGQLADAMLALVRDNCQVTLKPAPNAYQVPTGPSFAYYQLRLEQALAVGIARTLGSPAEFLSGEREIIHGNIQQCLEFPANPLARVLLAQTLRSLKFVRPNIVEEYRDKIALLQQEHRLPAPYHIPVQQLIDDIYNPPSPAT